MKNTLGDLSLHLFAQLERLNDEELQGEKLKEEVVRAKAITEVSKQIIDNGNLVLQAKKFMDNRMDMDNELPRMLQG